MNALCNYHILINIKSKYKYIARDENGLLYVYETKPEKSNYTGKWMTDHAFECLRAFEETAIFLNVKWSDPEPTLIVDLLSKLEYEL